MTDPTDDEPQGPPPELAHTRGWTWSGARSRRRVARHAVRERTSVAAGRRRRKRVPNRGGRRRWSGPGPDARDPQTLGSLTSQLAKSRGWAPKVAEGSVFGQWETVVGEQIAEHANPTTLRDGILTVEAESTAWATQLRMVQPQLLAKIAAAVGDGVVTSLKIVGPAAPTWRKGKYNVPGRGPRDTYG